MLKGGEKMIISAGVLPIDMQAAQGLNANGQINEEDYKTMGVFGLLMNQQLLANNDNETTIEGESSAGVNLETLLETFLEKSNSEGRELASIVSDFVAVVEQKYPGIQPEQIKEILINKMSSEMKLLKNEAGINPLMENVELTQIHQVETTYKKIMQETNPHQFRDGILAFVNKEKLNQQQKQHETTDLGDTKIIEEQHSKQPGDLKSFQGLFYGKKIKVGEDKVLPPSHKPSVMETIDQNLEAIPGPIFNTMKVQGAPNTEMIHVALQDFDDVVLQLASKDIQILQKGEVTTGKLKLYPEELGQVTVHLEMIKGDLSIRIIASNEGAFNHLQHQSKELVQRFTENGTFSEVSVDLHMGDSGQDNSDNHGFQKHYGKSASPSENMNIEEDINDYIDLSKGSYSIRA